jgi:HlyD family secretion protein
MRRNRVLWGAMVLLATCGAAAILDRLPGPVATAQTPASSGQAQVHALARLEPADGLIAVGARQGARIDRILVAEGDEVKKDDPLAVLEGQETLKAQLDLAKAQKRAADEQRAHKREAVEIERARDDRVQKTRLEMLQNIYRTLALRVEQSAKLRPDLEKAQVPPRQLADFDEALDRLRVENFRAYLEQERAKADQDALPKQRALEDKQLADDSAEAQVLDQQIKLAEAGLEALTIRAPAAGRVLEMPAHAGESSTGILLFLGDVSKMVAVAEVDQSDADTLQEGNSAQVTIHDATVDGKVTRIGRLVGRNQAISLDPRSLQDLRVVKVTIQLRDAQKAARYVNMQVDAAITPTPRAPVR